MSAKPSPPDESDDPDEQIDVCCGACGSSSVEADYQNPLCAPCRTNLSNRAIPPLVVLVAAISMSLAVLALFKYPAALRAAVAVERADRAEQKSDFASAEKQLLVVTAAYPKYDDGMISLAQDSYNAGDYRVTAVTLDKLDGRDFDQDQMDRINAIEAGLEKIEHQNGDAK